MNTALLSQFKAMLNQGLQDDGWELDWTTLGTLKNSDQKSSAKIVAKSDGVWVGEELCHALQMLSQELGSSVQTKCMKKNGDRIKKGETVCQWSGSTRAMLALERPFLNIASYLGGIALQTRKLVDQVDRSWKKKSAPKPRVTSTRKTLPEYRDLAVHAVMAGGGFSHRVSLSGGVLIKENHIAAAGSISRALEGVRAVAPHGLKLEIEVRSQDELNQALEAGADVVMLDNFTPKQVLQSLKILKTKSPKTVVEVSGGLNEKNIASYALEGVSILSVGSLTHSVQAIDLSLLFS